MTEVAVGCPAVFGPTAVRRLPQSGCGHGFKGDWDECYGRDKPWLLLLGLRYTSSKAWLSENIYPKPEGQYNGLGTGIAWIVTQNVTCLPAILGTNSLSKGAPANRKW